MPFLEENVDVVVVGAGHAGCEAALACARLGLETVIFTVSVDSIALMPCNLILEEALKDIWFGNWMHWAVRWEKLSTARLFSLKC